MELFASATTLHLGLVLGTVALLAYLIKMRASSILMHAVNSFISGNAIVSGISVCYSVLARGFECRFSEIDTICIFLGGISVIWVSVRSLANAYTNRHIVKS